MSRRTGHVVRVVSQRKDWDCGIAALAMLLDRPYGDISCVARQLIPVVPRRGLGLYHLERIAKHFEFPLRRVYRSKDYLTCHKTGIVGVLGGGVCWAGHWVVLKEGVILDPDDKDKHVYSLDEYASKSRPKNRYCTLLVPAGDPS